MSETRNNGGPAFAGGMMPHPADRTKAVPIAQLSVRDWFAGHASEQDIQTRIAYWTEDGQYIQRSREAAKYAYADDMLTARAEG